MAAQHDMSADIKLAEQNASSITLGIDGAPHDPQKLTAMLRKHGMTQTVISCELVHELAQPNSITGALDLALDDGSTKRLFVKKMTAAQVAHKAWNDRRRSLLYMRNEVRFYSEFPELAERGVRYPMVYGVEDRLDDADRICAAPFLSDKVYHTCRGDGSSRLLAHDGGYANVLGGRLQPVRDVVGG